MSRYCEEEKITGQYPNSKTLADVVAALQALIPPDISNTLPASDLACGTVIGRAYAHLPITLATNITEGHTATLGDGSNSATFQFCEDPITYSGGMLGNILVAIGETAEETLSNLLAAIETSEDDIAITYEQDGTSAVLISTIPGVDVALTASLPEEGNTVGINSYPIAPVPIANESTPCKGVLIMAPCSVAGVPSNTAVAFIGNDTIQNIPIVQSNIEGVMIHIDDASKMFVKVGADGESINYVILQ